MFQLTREVRFAVNIDPDWQLDSPPTNTFGGFPSLIGLGHFYSLAVTLAGQTDPHTGCLVDIKHVDAIVRQRVIPLMSKSIRQGRGGGGGLVLGQIYQILERAFGGLSLDRLELALSPFMSLAVLAREYPMLRLSQKFEFSASHRLHNPALGDEDNRRIFGKCNNPHGHGHNYIVEVAVAGEPDSNGTIVVVPKFESIVSAAVIERFDHKNLNIETEEFAGVIPTVENIAMVIYRLLKSPLAQAGAKLAEVTVWETPKTWCQYSE